MIKYDELNERDRDEVRAYVENGAELRASLRAAFANNFVEAHRKSSDDERRWLTGLAAWLFMRAPGLCWGDDARVAQWQKDGGLIGYVAKARKVKRTRQNT